MLFLEVMLKDTKHHVSSIYSQIVGWEVRHVTLSSANKCIPSMGSSPIKSATGGVNRQMDESQLSLVDI